MNNLVYLLLILLLACNKSENEKRSNNSNEWNVKYELTSTNPNAKVSFMYMDKSGNFLLLGGTDTSTFISLPWSYEAKYSKDPGMSNARYLRLTPMLGTNVSIYTSKIYVDGKLVNQAANNEVMYTLQ